MIYTLVKPTKQQAALCLETTLSLHNYSSEGRRLNRDEAKRLRRKIHNMHFSASLVHAFPAERLSGSSRSSDVQSS